MIERKQGIYQGRNKSSAYRDLVWTVATAADTSQNMADQTRQALATIDANLQELSSDKSHIVSVQVYIADMSAKAEMDSVWCEWIGDDPQNWPQRACLGVELEGDVLVEITVTAVRHSGS